jgi:NADPH-dependent curcumin reductase CurA
LATAELNPQWTLARTPPGGLPVADDFVWRLPPIPEPDRNQMLTRTLYLSLDPYQWGRRRGGVEAVGDVCHGRAVAQVIASRLDGFREGDFVFNTNGWQTYGLTGDGISVFGYMYPRKLDPAIAPISTAVGVLGMLGLTAYAGLIVQCKPQRGETVVVSAASGGVGQVVGQLGKVYGCRVVGIAGTREKCDFVTRELGFDACVSHRSATLADELAAACPDGIDVYFENVGGPAFEAVLPHLNHNARISVCGLISQYGNTGGGNPPRGLGPRDAWAAAGQPYFDRRSVAVHDLHVRNYVADHQAEFFDKMAAWLRDGRVKYKEDVWQGLERAPEAFRAMLDGNNFGKTLIAVGADPSRA